MPILTRRRIRPLHRSATTLALVFTAVALFGCSPAVDPNGSGSSPSVTITAQTPGTNQLVKGNVSVSGTFKGENGAVNVEIVAAVKGVEVGRDKSGKFTFTWDTKRKDDKGGPAFKDGKQCVLLTARAAGGTTATRSICVTVDNTDPLIEIFEPKPDAVHIGRVTVKGRVTDKNLALVGGWLGEQMLGWCDKAVEDGKPNSCTKCVDDFNAVLVAAGKKPSAVCINKSGDFSFEIDRRGEPTADLTLTVAAADGLGTQVKVDRKFKVLKAPEFETARTQVDATTGPISAMLSNDFDGDGVIDVVVAAANGVFLRRGVPVPKSEPAKGSGDFAPAQKLESGDCKRLVRLDLDGDGVLDVVAVRIVQNVGSEAIAFLTRPGGLRLVEIRAFPGTATAAAAGDLDGDAVADVVIGGDEDTNALTILRVLKNPKCPSKDAPDRLCKDATVGATIGPGKIFASLEQHKLTGGISAVGIADFIDEGPSSSGWNDIVLGRGSKAIVSVCRNDSGKILGCIDTNSNSWVADLTDTKLLLITDWNLDNKPDLIVTSVSSGVTRWLAGNGDGSFTFNPQSYRSITAPDVDATVVAPIGPNNADYLAIIQNGRSVALIPVSPFDDAHVRKCFRSFVLGSSIVQMDPADIDNDGNIDFVGIDAAGPGIAVALGTGDGNYRAAAIHRVCGSPPDKIFHFTTLDISHFAFEDLTLDGKPDLMMLSTANSSFLVATKSIPPGPVSAYTVHLYVNLGTQLDEAARAAEISPYLSQQGSKIAGIRGDVTLNGAGKKLPNITGFATGELGAGPGRDFAITLGAEYTTGAAPNPLIPDDPKKPNISCLHREYHEVCNAFGEQSPEDPQPGNIKACKNYNVADKDLKESLTGYGGGAGFDRASLLIFTSIGNASEPFGLSPAGTPGKPGEMRPFYAQSAGINPIGLVVGRFDEDALDDIATVMPARGYAAEITYLHDRVRFFKSDVQGRVRAVVYVNDAKGEAQTMFKDQNVQSDQMEFITVPDASGQDTWVKLNKDLKYQEDIAVTYRTLGSTPSVAVGASFCAESLTSVFSFNRINGQFTAVRALGGMNFTTKSDTFSIGSDVSAATVRAVDADDDCSDVLYAKKAKLGFFRGTDNWFDLNDYFFDVETADVQAVETADVNQDKLLDLLVVDAERSTLEIFLGDGRGGFHQVKDPLLSDVVASAVKKADINGDGCTELAVQGSRGIAIFRNLGCQ